MLFAEFNLSVRWILKNWSEWKNFPDPQKCEYLIAPFGPGCYELRNRKTNEKVLYGKGANLASRMTSLLPKPFGCGTRNNKEKRTYVLANIQWIEYRTSAFGTVAEAKECENRMRQNKAGYLFST